MKVKVYLRDWYFNAGIIGFLYVLSDGNINIEKIKKQFKEDLVVGDNFLIFDSNILNGFFDKYIKISFNELFDIDEYKERIQNLLKNIDDKNENRKISKKFISETNLSGKIVNSFIKEIYGKSIDEIFKEDDVVGSIKNLNNTINKYNLNNEVYKFLKEKNSNFIGYFLKNEISKKICSYEKIDEYIVNICNYNESKQDEQNLKCFICSNYKKKYEFNNSITQIVGFNQDNSNWIWGCNASKVMICAVCALFYSCALHGMVYIKRKINNEFKTFYYSLNRNINLSMLYNSFFIFKSRIKKNVSEKDENQNKPFYTILQEITLEVVNKSSEATLENINFIEISENDFGGKSTKNYNVYAYNITKEIASFIKSIDKDKIMPKGFYSIRNNFIDIREEILKKTLENTLNFSDLTRYFEYFMESLEPKNNIKVRYSLNNILKYILLYINLVIKGGDKMELEKIVNKGYQNGVMISKKINQENKIKGVVYQMLNDLKIYDRNSFMDKYLRLSMAYDSEIKLGSNNELSDIDNFISFGYAFINGMLSNVNSKVNSNEIRKNNEEIKNV